MFGKGKDKVGRPDMEYFTIFDTKVGNYRDPILAVNAAQIIRDLELMFGNPKNEMDQYVANAEDFQLFKVGEYYRSTGSIVGLEPIHVANLHDIKASVTRRAQAAVGGQDALRALSST